MEVFNTFVVFVAFNLLFSPVLIYFLRNSGFYKKKDLPQKTQVNRNDKYYKHLLDNMSTPSSYGVLYVFNLFVLYFVLNQTLETKAVILGAILLGLVGLADDIYQFFYYKDVGQWGFKARYKMIIQLLTFFLVFYTTGNSLEISIIFSIVSTFILNSFNITDGLDGLAGGIAMPTFLVFGVLEYASQGLTPVFFLILTTIAFIFIFMCYNIKPAKVFLGDSGSYAIGVVLAILVLRFDLLISLPLVALFLIEGISSLLQIVSIKIFNKRVFTIAPLHLHLLNSGWTQWQVIAGAWIVQTFIVLSVLLFSNVGF